MSGVNWLPAWTLDPRRRTAAFARSPTARRRPTASATSTPIRELLRRASALRAARRRARARSSRAASRGISGNEFSNLREPASPARRRGVERALDRRLLRRAPARGATGGMHGEDLERDRNLRPSSASPRRGRLRRCTATRSTARFSRGRLDTDVVPFLCAAAAVVQRQARALQRVRQSRRARREAIASTRLSRCLDEARDGTVRDAACYRSRSHARGALGGFWWCWADYDPRARARCRRSTARRTSCVSGSSAPTARSNRSRSARRRSPQSAWRVEHRSDRRRAEHYADSREHRARVPRHCDTKE